MKLGDVLSALRRRWYIVVASLLVAAGVGYLAWTNIDPDYERSATQLLLPGAATVPEGANPYLYVGGLAQATDILVRAAGAEDILAEAASEFPGTVIDVARDSAAGAVVVTTVTATSDQAAADVLSSMLELNVEVLNDLQDAQRIPSDERISIMPLTADTQSEVIQKTRTATSAVAVLGVVLLGLFIAGLIDGAFKPRRRVRPIDVHLDKEERNGTAETSDPIAGESLHRPVVRSTAASLHAAQAPSAVGADAGEAPVDIDAGDGERVESSTSDEAIPTREEAESDLSDPEAHPGDEAAARDGDDASTHEDAAPAAEAQPAEIDDQKRSKSDDQQRAVVDPRPSRGSSMTRRTPQAQRRRTPAMRKKKPAAEPSAQNAAVGIDDDEAALEESAVK